MAMLGRSEIEKMGFASVGDNVQISDRASFYGTERIALGDYVRIDDFCVFSAGEGGISIGYRAHIGAYSSLIGAGKITISDLSGVSSRVSIYSSSDNYSGTTLAGPTMPAKYTGVTHADVLFEKHVMVGCGSVILPGVVLEEGVAVGALSLVTKRCKAFGIYAGRPARRIKERKRDLLELERRFLSEMGLQYITKPNNKQDEH